MLGVSLGWFFRPWLDKAIYLKGDFSKNVLDAYKENKSYHLLDFLLNAFPFLFCSLSVSLSH